MLHTTAFWLIMQCLSIRDCRIRNACAKWRRWLDSDAAQVLPTSDYSSSSFCKGTRPAYRETYDESAQASISSLDPF
jgi:hypothetical protein